MKLDLVVANNRRRNKGHKMFLGDSCCTFCKVKLLGELCSAAPAYSESWWSLQLWSFSTLTWTKL